MGPLPEFISSDQYVLQFVAAMPKGAALPMRQSDLINSSLERALAFDVRFGLDVVSWFFRYLSSYRSSEYYGGKFGRSLSDNCHHMYALVKVPRGRRSVSGCVVCRRGAAVRIPRRLNSLDVNSQSDSTLEVSGR